MTISSKKSFKAQVIDKDGLARKVRLRVVDDVIYQDGGAVQSLFLTILLFITVIGIIILEIIQHDPGRHIKLVAMNEIKGIKRVNFKINPQSDKEFRTIALAVGYDQMIFIATNEENDLVRYINEQAFEELTDEEYQRIASKYDNRIQMFRDSRKYAPIIILIVLLLLAIAIATPIILSNIF